MKVCCRGTTKTARLVQTCNWSFSIYGKFVANLSQRTPHFFLKDIIKFELFVFFLIYSFFPPLVCLGWSPKVHYSDSILQEAHLLHWNGPFKPWNYPAAHSDLWEKWFIPDPSGTFSLARPESDG